jgi:hypothetical protein
MHAECVSNIVLASQEVYFPSDIASDIASGGCVLDLHVTLVTCT